jgi:excisionase family DNA binding protein
MSAHPPRIANRPVGGDPTTALFVRIPAEHARRLDRAAFELKLPKQRLVSGLLERYVDPDSPSSLAALGAAGESEGRRITVQSIEPSGLTVGHHSFRPREPDVLTCDEVAELLRVEPELIERMAGAGELPARQLAGQWRFSRQALLRWLAGEPPASGPEPERSTDTALGVTPAPGPQSPDQ